MVGTNKISLKIGQQMNFKNWPIIAKVTTKKSSNLFFSQCLVEHFNDFLLNYCGLRVQQHMT